MRIQSPGWAALTADWMVAYWPGMPSKVPTSSTLPPMVGPTGATPTTGLAKGTPPSEPANGASPKLKMPPSAATSQ